MFPKHARTWGYFYLANLIIPATFLFLAPKATALFGAALLFLFALIYIASYRFGLRWRLFCAALESILVMVMAGVINPGYYWVATYPFVLLHITLTGRKRLLALTLLAATFLIQFIVLLRLHHIGVLTALPYLVVGIFILFSVMISMRFQERSVAATDALKAANLEIKRLTEAAERDRISQDLHDVMGHELSMITLKAQLIDRLVQRDPDRARAEVRDVEQAARKALTRVREYVANIRRARLDEEWSAALQLLKTARIACDCSPPDFSSVTVDGTSETLAMCLRESVTNIIRHSRATRALLILDRKEGMLSVVVADNGSGLRSREPTRAAPEYGDGGHGGSLATIEPDSLGRSAGRRRRADNDVFPTASQSKRQAEPVAAFDAHESAAAYWTANNTHGLSGMRARLDAVGGTFAVWSNGRALHAERTACPPGIPWRRGLTLQLSVPVVFAASRTEGASQ
ncbi:MAG: sensor histidine kinase [Bacilli bacterium]